MLHQRALPEVPPGPVPEPSVHQGVRDSRNEHRHRAGNPHHNLPAWTRARSAVLPGAGTLHSGAIRERNGDANASVLSLRRRTADLHRRQAGTSADEAGAGYAAFKVRHETCERG
uniref:(northern house mosquito) hypothetical protein n=1 Tax=Culex pipiens TaxID=7175 RepID=A0A8D8N903_CULPI